MDTSCQLLLASCPSNLLVELLQTWLPSAASLEDSLWASLDTWLPWLRRLLNRATYYSELLPGGPRLCRFRVSLLC